MEAACGQCRQTIERTVSVPLPAGSASRGTIEFAHVVTKETEKCFHQIVTRLLWELLVAVSDLSVYRFNAPPPKKAMAQVFKLVAGEGRGDLKQWKGRGKMPFDLDSSVDLSRAKKITLGHREISIAPLTLRRTIKAAGMLPELNQAASPVDNIEKLLDFVMLGLERTYPTLTREDLLDSEAPSRSCGGAVDVLVELAGGKNEAAAAPQ